MTSMVDTHVRDDNLHIRLQLGVLILTNHHHLVGRTYNSAGLGASSRTVLVHNSGKAKILATTCKSDFRVIAT